MVLTSLKTQHERTHIMIKEKASSVCTYILYRDINTLDTVFYIVNPLVHRIDYSARLKSETKND